MSDSYSNNFGHSESRDGYRTSGSYRVALPDSRTQIVTYTADENGLVSDVKYEGEAVFPAETPRLPIPQLLLMPQLQSTDLPLLLMLALTKFHFKALFII